MRLLFSPCGGVDVSTVIEVIDDNTVRIDGEDWSVPSEVVQVDPAGPILAGSRDGDGVLSLTILVRYRDADKGIWEMPPYRGQEYEDHGPGVIQWQS